jgi:hypothetical protein
MTLAPAFGLAFFHVSGVMQIAIAAGEQSQSGSRHVCTFESTLRVAG